MFNRRKGMNWAHVVSLVTAAVVAMMWFQVTSRCSWASSSHCFAVINFQILQAHHHAAKYGDPGGRCRLVEAMNILIDRQIWHKVAASRFRKAQGIAGNSVNRSESGPGAPFPSEQRGPTIATGGSCSNTSGRGPRSGRWPPSKLLSGKRTFL